MFAFICGIYAEIGAGRAGIPQDAIEWHEFMANVASWGFVLLAAWRLMLDPRSRRVMSIYVSLGLLWYVLLGLTAYLGGQLVFTYGAAVTSGTGGTLLSLHDLNTLAVRQTDLNLRYSEMMHHIFGWLTLALAVSLLAHALLSKSGKKLRWIGPVLLLAGGVFLFFCADLDLYRLTDLRQLRDREVQLHKTLAIVLMSAGDAELLQPASSAAELPLDPAMAKSLPGEPDLTVRLIARPHTLTAGTHAMLLFHLDLDGQPVTDLEPYMGTIGHCAIVSQDTAMMIQCHPEQLYPMASDDRGRPDVAFHAVFPSPGRYKT